MGLREMKVARTREAIIDAALDLFLEHGYDAATMEQIAERVEIGTSTLYRYFPTKDLIILDRFSRSLDFGGLLRARPADEALGDSLREVVCDAIAVPYAADERFVELRRVVDNAPVPRARLWDLFAQARDEFQSALAERLGGSADDLGSMMTARLTFEIYEIAGERWWAGDHRRPVAEVVDEVLAGIGESTVVYPSRNVTGPAATAAATRSARAPASRRSAAPSR